MLRSIALALIMVMTLVTSSAFALNIDATDISSLPTVTVVGVEIDNGPTFAAVQPTAFLKVKHSSCAKMPLSTETQEQGGVLFVSIGLNRGTVDCMGPMIEREYSFQISSDFRHSVVVLNPVKKIYR